MVVLMRSSCMLLMLYQIMLDLLSLNIISSKLLILFFIQVTAYFRNIFYSHAYYIDLNSLGQRVTISL
jgi:hypothetical protein